MVSVTSRDGSKDTGYENTDSGTPAPDTVFQALSEAIRRRILFHLLEQRETQTEDLARRVADWRSSTSDSGPKTCEQLVIELRHVHLPKLASASLIEYDSATGEIHLIDIPDQLREIVRYTHEYERTLLDDQ